jgi:hypothetical protein
MWKNIFYLSLNFVVLNAKCPTSTEATTSDNLLTSTDISPITTEDGANKIITVIRTLRPQTSTTTTTTTTKSHDRLIFTTDYYSRCTKRCWCGYTNICDCDCNLQSYKPPFFILTWNALVDLDLTAIEPSGSEILYLSQHTGNSGFLLKDTSTGPNAVEIIAWPHSSHDVSNGNYSVFVSFYSVPISDPIEYKVAVLESFQQGWKFFSGNISANQHQLVYEFEIQQQTKFTKSTPAYIDIVDMNDVCQMIYGSCSCTTYDNECNCAC